jgi:cytochrome c oxidase subunit 2
MNRVFSILFAGIMVAGLIVSSLLIVTSLQAAAASSASTTQVALQPVALSLEQQGHDLFMAKGCIVCHRNDRVFKPLPGSMEFSDIPNLTTIKIDAAYLRRWLHDPAAMKPGTQMPNLNLSDREIEALTAFLVSNSTP